MVIRALRFHSGVHRGSKTRFCRFVWGEITTLRPSESHHLEESHDAEEHHAEEHHAEEHGKKAAIPVMRPSGGGYRISYGDLLQRRGASITLDEGAWGS